MSCVGKIAFVDYPASLEYGEFFVTEETPHALFGIKLGTEYDKHRLHRLPKNQITLSASTTPENSEDFASDLSSELFSFSRTRAGEREYSKHLYEQAEATSDYLDRWVDRRVKGKAEVEKLAREYSNVMRDLMFANLR